MLTFCHSLGEDDKETPMEVDQAEAGGEEHTPGKFLSA